MTKVNWGAVLVRCGAIGSSLLRPGGQIDAVFPLSSRTQDATRNGDIDREKPPVMNATAVWKFGVQWCSGWCCIVVVMASDRDAFHGEM